MLYHVTTQVITDLAGIPPGTIQQPLHPVRRRVPGRLRQLPAVLALQRGQQPHQVQPSLPPRLHPPEPARHPREQRI
jgi:hypothetical protein